MLDATPFFVGAASQVPGVALQRIIDMLFQGEYGQILTPAEDVDSGEPVVFVIPPGLSKVALSQRWARDSDALLAALFAITFLVTMLTELSDLQKHIAPLLLLGTAGVGVPVVAIVIILGISPDNYCRKSLFKKILPITPFAYSAVTLSVIVGLGVLYFS